MTPAHAISLPEADDIVVRCNSYDRLPTILNLEPYMAPADWITLMRDAWSRCDNVGLYADELSNTILGLLKTPIMEMMTPEAASEYEKLPDYLVVYRGCYSRNKCGLSWTTNRAVAAKFPFLHRYKQDGQALLVTGRIRKSEIVALVVDRGESEVITFTMPRHVSTRHLRTMGASDEDQLGEAR